MKFSLITKITAGSDMPCSHTRRLRSAVVIDLPVPSQNDLIYGAKSLIWKNKAKISREGRAKGVYSTGELIYQNTNMIYGNEKPIFEMRTIIKENRNVFRSKFIDVRGNGSMGGFVLNSILMDIAEV